MIILKILLLISLTSLIYSLFIKHKKNKLEKSLMFFKNERDKEHIKLTNFLRKNKEGYFSYDRIEKYLKKLGEPLSPASYILSKFLLTIIFIGYAFLARIYVFSILFGVIGYFSLDMLLKYRDRRDMKQIKIELADLYDLLNIQLSAGVFIGDTLMEGYLIVSNKRFKKSLKELSAEISMTRNIEKALENFNNKFSSLDIDCFVMTVNQSLITGQAQQAVEDMSNSIKEFNLIQIQEQTKAINITASMIQLLMLLGIMAMIIFGLYIELSKSWSVMFN